MSLDFQITVDCAHPHPLAAWWARTLGWNVEPSDETFIREMIRQGLATEDDTEVYDGALVWREGSAISNPQSPASPRVLFQLVPDPKTVKNRLHFDVRLKDQTLDEAREELEQRGATFLHEGSQGPHRWYTLADPEGNEFCITL